jgi:hypothetical protein
MPRPIVGVTGPGDDATAADLTNAEGDEPFPAR